MTLEVTDLTIRIGRRELVHEVSFSVEAGERLGIIGESGSGKSLTVQALFGLLPHRAVVSGSIRWNGVELVGRSDRELAAIRGKEVGVVFQDPSSSLDPIRTVEAQIGQALDIHYALSSAERRERVVRAAAQVGLPDPERLIARYPHQLSGGQRQRVAIAAAIITSPRLLIADEPTTALDVTVQAGIIELFTDLVEQLGSSLIFVTHDIALLSSIVTDALVMSGGRVIERGALDALLSAPTDPITAELVAAARATSWSGDVA